MRRRVLAMTCSQRCWCEPRDRCLKPRPLLLVPLLGIGYCCCGDVVLALVPLEANTLAVFTQTAVFWWEPASGPVPVGRCGLDPQLRVTSGDRGSQPEPQRSSRPL